MTEKTLYECDRCEKEFKVNVGSHPDTINISPHWPNDEPENKDLCFDCAMALEMFMGKKNVEQFDALAEKISEAAE